MISTQDNAGQNRTIGDKYEVIEVLGQGGMGAVLKARHKQLSKIVAIKVLNPTLLADESSRARFELEAQAGSNLNHPNLIVVFDYGYTAESDPYLVMEYVDGWSLDAMLETYGRPRPSDIVPVLVQVCKALRYLHENNIIHRDLKPANIMIQDISGERYAKLVDLGIAKVLSKDGQATQHLTATGSIFGSPLYMSPEQCRGEKVDARSDIYSLGCVMYECLAGRVPLVGENHLQTLHKHLMDTPEPIPCNTQAEHELSQVVFKCLEKSKEHRFQSVGDLLESLTLIERKIKQADTGVIMGIQANSISFPSLSQQLDSIPTPSNASPLASRQIRERKSGINQQPPSGQGSSSSFRQVESSTEQQASDLIKQLNNFYDEHKNVLYLALLLFFVLMAGTNAIGMSFQLNRSYNNTVNSLAQFNDRFEQTQKK